MGTATSKQEEPEIKNVNVQNGAIDISTPTDKEQNDSKNYNQNEKEPVIEEEIVPQDGIQVQSFLAAPGVSKKITNL